MLSDRELSPLGINFVGTAGGVMEFKLKSNGLTILLAPDTSSDVAAVYTVVQVGSRNETLGTTGSSHLLEHRMFGETTRFNAERGNSFSQFMGPLGGQDNAFTCEDCTVLFAFLPNSALAQYFQYDADRLRGIWLNEADVQGEVRIVLDEMATKTSLPGFIFDCQLKEDAFPTHPYRHPIIGLRRDVENLSALDLRRHYNNFYWPNNASLIVIGGFDPLTVLTSISQAYRHIQPSPAEIPEVKAVLSAQLGEKRFVLHCPGDAVRVTLAVRSAPAGHSDHYAFKALATLLGGSDNSPLQRALVDKGLATFVSVHADSMRDAGLFKISAWLCDGVNPERVERIMLRQLQLLGDHPPSMQQLHWVKRQNLVGTMQLRASLEARGHSLAMAQATAGWRNLPLYDTNFNAITPESISDVVRGYFGIDQQIVGMLLPPTATVHCPAVQPKAQLASVTSLSPCLFDSTANAVKVEPEAGTTGTTRFQPAAYGDRVRKFVLSNGLSVLLVHSDADCAAVLALTLDAGLDRAPQCSQAICHATAFLVASGSRKFSRMRVGDLSAEMAFEFGFHPGESSCRMSSFLLPSDLPTALDMIADALINPLFRPNELQRYKTSASAYLESWQDDAESQAYRALSQAVYQQGSPMHSPDFTTRQDDLDRLDLEQICQFHQAAYRPDGAILTLVGNFDVSHTAQLVESRFQRWEAAIDISRAPNVYKADRVPSRTQLRIAGQDNVFITMGTPADIRLKSSDRTAAFLANAMMGGDISSRLGRQLRERLKLTYGVCSFYNDTLFGGGLCQITMTTSREHVDDSLAAIQSLLAEACANGVSEDELAIQKECQINTLRLSLADPRTLAQSLSWSEFAQTRFAGPQAECFAARSLDSYAVRVDALTQEDVNAAIRKYFNFQDAQIVIVGDLDA